MGLIKGLLFWAYLDDRGRIYVKRYTNDGVIANYERMPFCRGIFGPFEAIDMAQAQMLVRERYAMEKEDERKHN